MSNDQMRALHEQWHKMISAGNLDGLMDLYTEDATLESSAILVIEGDQTGTLTGKAKLKKHFGEFFAIMQSQSAVKLYEPMKLHVDGKTAIWEYPSKNDKGLQLDVVESIDVVNGKITYQRVYWGWVGFKILWKAAEYRKRIVQIV